MNKPTEETHWKAELTRQGRSLAWLADNTGWKRRTVYAYSRGQNKPSAAWLAKASQVLGVEVSA